MAIVSVAPVGAQFGNKPTRPQVKPPDGPVRQVIFKNCTSCHGIDDYAYNALDRAGWNALLEARHKQFATFIADKDRAVLLDQFKKSRQHVLIVEPISQRISPWWDAWATEFTTLGGRADVWKARIDPPLLVKKLAKASGLRPEMLTARSLFL